MKLKPATVNGRTARQAAIGRNVSLKDISQMAHNISGAWHNAAAHPDVDHERSWYEEASQYIGSLAVGHSMPYDRSVAVVAALSPGTSWERNLDLAEQALAGEEPNHAYGDCIRKAYALMAGSNISDTLGGRKVRSFYYGLLTAGDTGHVTIDRHSGTLALYGEPTSISGRSASRANDVSNHLAKVGVYQSVVIAHRIVAAKVGRRVTDVQSVTWEYWRLMYAYKVKQGEWF